MDVHSSTEQYTEAKRRSGTCALLPILLKRKHFEFYVLVRGIKLEITKVAIRRALSEPGQSITASVVSRSLTMKSCIVDFQDLAAQVDFPDRKSLFDAPHALLPPSVLGQMNAEAF